jgi:hypothetical protein
VNGVVVLICAFVLILDLADDGRFGKDTFLAHHPPVKSLNVASDDYGFGKADSQNELPQINFLEIPSHFAKMPTTPVVQPPPKIIGFCHLSSAGGLPL